MKISLITVCYNSELTIRDTIESVLSQDHSDIEYIVIDGGSSDGTTAILEEYQSRISRIISEPDHGLYDAMNKGVRLSTGDFVGTLNSDDLFADERVISSLVEFLTENPNLDGSFADLVLVRRDNVDHISRSYSSKWFSEKLIRFGLMLPHPTFYVKRHFFGELGYYKLGYPAAADFELIARFIKNGVRVARHPKLMIKMREGGISNAGFLGRVKQNFEIVRACKENGIYTNIFLVAFKIPFKLASYFFR